MSISSPEIQKHRSQSLDSPPVPLGSRQMEKQNSESEHGNVVEISVDEHSSEGRRVCSGAVCGFADATTTSKDTEQRSASMRKLLTAVVLCVIFMAAEVVGGIKANSLAILTDAAHLLSDVAAFAISLFALWASGWEATPRQTYGFFRIEILGALVSIQMIWLLAGILVYEATVRIYKDAGEVNGFLMFCVAAFGLVVNVLMAILLGHDHGHNHAHGHDHGHDHILGHGHTNDHGHGSKQPLLKKSGCSEKDSSPKGNINVQGAYLHVLGDSIQSVGVMLSGGIIWYKPEWKILDLICTLLFSVVVLGTTINMLRNILEVLMESTPREIDATKLEKGLLEMEEVDAIHELHIWAITVGKVLLACHVKIKEGADADGVLDKVIEYIKREYNISHVTVQIER